MLQVIDGRIEERANAVATSLFVSGQDIYFGDTGMAPTTSACMQVGSVQWWNSQPYTIYQSYPVYVCTDKTKKAIDVLKALQDDKVLECKSVPRFIELVERIANLL